MDNGIIEKRVRKLKDRPFDGGPVVYWLTRDQRVNDNWAMIYAAGVAKEESVPLHVVFCLVPEYLEATLRQYAFMLKGLQELERKTRHLGIHFTLLEGSPELILPSFLHSLGTGLLVIDFDTLRIKREWKARTYTRYSLPIHEVDAHNIVPCWSVASRKVSSYEAFRALVMPLLDEFLTDIPPLTIMGPPIDDPVDRIDWPRITEGLKVDGTVKEVRGIEPGEEAAKEALGMFVRDRLINYREHSRNPWINGQSELSPYLHFGHLSAQRVALEVRASDVSEEVKAHFLDQLVVKKEISDNFCLHTPHYDTLWAFPQWARRSLDRHRLDSREYLYPLEKLETGATHDPLWNATQTQLVKAGRIHGSLREYWAAKILEWTRNPEEALSIAIYLNNRYGLDGRDPIGYAGIASAIGGLYGRPWNPKKILGKVRRVSYTEERMEYDLHAYQEMVKKM